MTAVSGSTIRSASSGPDLGIVSDYGTATPQPSPFASAPVRSHAHGTYTRLGALERPSAGPLRPVWLMLLLGSMTHYELQTVRPATRRVCTIIGSIVFAIGAAWEWARVLLNRPWAGVADWLSDAVSVAFATLWLIAAALLLWQQSRPRLHFPALLCAIGGTFVMVAHGAVTRVLGSPFGSLYWLLAAVQIVLLRRSLLRAAVPHRVTASA